jgi:RNA polymerase sigma-70 factor (ECF subfamily)
VQLRGDATDPAAEFDRFYAASVAAVTRQLFALTGDRAEAEDVVAEAFERAWLRLPVAQVAAETGASVSAVNSNWSGDGPRWRCRWPTSDSLPGSQGPSGPVGRSSREHRPEQAVAPGDGPTAGRTAPGSRGPRPR